MKKKDLMFIFTLVIALVVASSCRGKMNSDNSTEVSSDSISVVDTVQSDSCMTVENDTVLK